MKIKLLLPFLLLPLLLAGCQQPDDDVDFPEPEPQKPVKEMILGQWDNYSTTYQEYDADANVIKTVTSKTNITFEIDTASVDFYTRLDRKGLNYNAYTLTEKDGKYYIEWSADTYSGTERYQITSISDSTMTWEVTDSLHDYVKREFRRLQTTTKYKLTGNWTASTTKKVTYDASGSVVNTESVATEFNKLDIYKDQRAFVYWNEKENSDGSYYYKVANENSGKADLHFQGDDTYFDVEVSSISDNKMTWKRMQSPTVAYVTEFTKVDKPIVPDKSVAAKVIGKWVERDFPGSPYYTLDGKHLSIKSNLDLWGEGLYSIVERDGKAYISYLGLDNSWNTYEITQLSANSMTWVPTDKPFLPDTFTIPGTIVLSRTQ